MCQILSAMPCLSLLFHTSYLSSKSPQNFFCSQDVACIVYWRESFLKTSTGKKTKQYYLSLKSRSQNQRMYEKTAKKWKDLRTIFTLVSCFAIYRITKKYFTSRIIIFSYFLQFLVRLYIIFLKSCIYKEIC